MICPDCGQSSTPPPHLHGAALSVGSCRVERDGSISHSFVGRPDDADAIMQAAMEQADRIQPADKPGDVEPVVVDVDMEVERRPSRSVPDAFRRLRERLRAGRP